MPDEIRIKGQTFAEWMDDVSRVLRDAGEAEVASCLLRGAVDDIASIVRVMAATIESHERRIRRLEATNEAKGDRP